MRFRPVAGPYGGSVRSITSDNAGWLFLATDGGVYRSSDNGSHWDVSLFPTQLYNFVEPVTVLGPNVVVAETDFNNFISTDKGNSWRYLYEDVHGFVVDSNGVIYAGSTYSGVRRSIDTARSWEQFALTGQKIWKVVMCGDGRIACPSDSGTFYSTDDGTTWTFRRYDTPFTWNLVSDKRGHLFVLRYYGQEFQMYRSDDFGQSWQHLVLPVAEDAWRIYVQSGGKISVPTSSRILTSTNAGETWDEIPFPIGTPLTVGWDVEGHLLAGSFYGLHRRNDASGEWEEMNNGIRARRIERIHLTHSGAILVQSLGEYFRSTDAGTTWPKLHFDGPFRINPYAPILSSKSGSIFIPAVFYDVQQSGLLRSTDDGLSWTRIPVQSNYYVIAGLAEGISGEILAATSFGDIYRSTDEGQSWDKVVSSTVRSGITCIASDHAGQFYAVKDTLVLLSGDGIVWESVPLRKRYASWESIVVDKDGRVFLGSTSDGVYLSSDHGRTWELLNEGLYDRFVMNMATDDNGNVLLGTGRSLYRLADSVDCWVRVGEGAPSTFMTAVAIDAHGYAYAGTQSYGMYRTATPLGKRVPKIWPPPTIGGAHFSLHQNYPNPFNGHTTIQYDVSLFAKVDIRIYSVLGEEIATLASLERPAGRYSVDWAPRQCASGQYFCVMKTTSSLGTSHNTIKILYIR